MPEWDIISYKESIERAEKWKDGCITGHHLIADHCMMRMKGVREGGADFAVLGAEKYRTKDAPVIMLTSDGTGGKYYMHGAVHDVFDPKEKEFADTVSETWRYWEARETAIASVLDAANTYSITIPWDKAKLKKVIDDYFITTCGFTEMTVLRAGEHTTPGSLQVIRKTGRSASLSHIGPIKTITKKPHTKKPYDK